MRSIVVDAGALVAFFDPDDEYRAAIMASLAKEPASATMLTTWPCVTEATHILARVEQQLRCLSSCALRGARFCRHGSRTLHCAHRKVPRSPDGFADASLVWLAAATGVNAILTTDRSDFEGYRLPSGKRFEIL